MAAVSSLNRPSEGSQNSLWCNKDTRVHMGWVGAQTAKLAIASSFVKERLCGEVGILIHSTRQVCASLEPQPTLDVNPS